MMGQLPLGKGSQSPSQESRVEPLRPACPSCMQILARLLACTKRTMRCHARTCSGL